MIGVHSFMEHHLLELAYNPFMLVLLAGIDTADEEKLGERYELKKMDNPVP